MRTLTFVCERHAEYGERGWRPLWMPNGDPLNGMAVAHDVLEHFPGDDGSVAHELMALGASLLVRGDGGYWQDSGNVNPPEAHVASDLAAMLWATVRTEGLREARMPHNAPGHVRTAAYEAVRLSVKQLRDEEAEFVPSDQQRARARCWLVRGYVRALRRFSHVDAHSLSYLFTQIEDAADRALRSCAEGEQLRVSVNLRRLRFTADTCWPEDA